MPINKLEQLRKYIFDIEIERIPFQQIFKIVGTAKTFSINSVSRMNQPRYDSLIERNPKRGMLLPF